MSAYLRYSLMTSFIVSMLVYSCIMLFPQWIISIFNSENNFMMMNIAIQGLPLYFFGFFFAGINMIFVSYFASVQKFKPSFFISLLRGGLIVIPLVMILSILFSLTGVWLSFPISECLITPVSYTHLDVYKRQASYIINCLWLVGTVNIFNNSSFDNSLKFLAYPNPY